MAARFVCTLFVITTLLTSAAPATANSPDKLSIEGVVRLLDVLDAIMEQNADYQSALDRAATMSAEERDAFFSEKARQNAADPTINEKIDALVTSQPYTLYYLKFRNVTKDIHREVLCALPYRAISSPAGIADHFKELCDHRDVVRQWITMVEKVDGNRCRDGAREWLPPADYAIPSTYFIFDGNGDAFALMGSVVFDIYSVVLAKRPAKGRYDNLETVTVERIERVLAHEFQHVFAGPYLYPSGRQYPTWQADWKDRFIRQFVSEGVAMRCSVDDGLRKTLMEDSVVVSYWIGQLNEKLAALDDGTITEDELSRWYSATYHETARELLKVYLMARYSHEVIGEKLEVHAAARPSFVYTLGWWMISRILEDGAGKDAVIGLLSDPQDLFDLYNEAVSARYPELRVVTK
jgi:hypothetical protein